MLFPKSVWFWHWDCQLYTIGTILTVFPTVIKLNTCFNAFTAVGALTTPIDFTLSNARRFYSAMGNPLAVQGLTTSKTTSPAINNVLTAVRGRTKPIDFTLSNARRFYWSMGNHLAVKGLTTSKTTAPLLSFKKRQKRKWESQQFLMCSTRGCFEKNWKEAISNEFWRNILAKTSLACFTVLGYRS